MGNRKIKQIITNCNFIATMKLIYSVFILFAEFKGIVALPASSIASATAGKPAPILSPPCQALCTKGSHSFYDPDTKKCTCVPDSKEEQKCLLETICVEYDIPMVPVWDDGTEKCNCKSRSNEEFICIAATTCLPGSSPYWNATTKQCDCLKTKPTSEGAKRDSIPQEKPTKTISPTPTPSASIDTCTFLKVFCECGDHHMHWSEEKQGCECPACPPVVSLGCENLMIHCNEGNHHMHWDPISQKCQCPSAPSPTIAARKLPIKHNDIDLLPRKEPAANASPAPTPIPKVDHCTLLKIFCPCGDHHSHWNEELQQCTCQPC